MITQKPSVNEAHASAKIVILEISSEANAKIKNNRFKSHKLRKLQSLDTSRHAKALKIFDKIDFSDFLAEQLPYDPLPLPSPVQKSHHQSSYLAYKEEQKLNKAKHNKVATLKTKISNHHVSFDSKTRDQTQQREVQTYDEPRTKRKMSMVLLGESLSQGNEDPSVLNRSRNIYIKTSEGKRQKIDPNTYMTKIKQKIQSLYECEAASNVFTNNYLQSNCNGMSIKISPFNQERHTLTRNIRTRNFKKESPRLNVQESSYDCRPWTSRKSEVPQQ